MQLGLGPAVWPGHPRPSALDWESNMIQVTWDSLGGQWRQTLTRCFVNDPAPADSEPIQAQTQLCLVQPRLSRLGVLDS
jgi:hypothetical protein